MGTKIFLLVIASVCLSALAQIALKHGMSTESVQRALQGEPRAVDVVASVALNFPVVLGLVMYALGAVSWLFVLARTDVSKAYPFMGLGFILTMVFAYLAFNEPIGLGRVLGTIMVAAGVVLVAHS